MYLMSVYFFFISADDLQATTARVQKGDETSRRNLKNAKQEVQTSVTKKDVVNCIKNTFAYLSRAVVRNTLDMSFMSGFLQLQFRFTECIAVPAKLLFFIPFLSPTKLSHL
jgi:hypothetical protein